MFPLTNVIVVCAFLYRIKCQAAENTGLYPGPEMIKNTLCEYSWETCDESSNRYNATLLLCHTAEVLIHMWWEQQQKKNRADICDMTFLHRWWRRRTGVFKK